MGFKIEEFDDLLTLGRITRELELSGHKFVLKTLSAAEYNKLMERTKVDKDMSDGQQMESIQRWALVYALDSVDGQKLGDDEKNKILSMCQIGLSNRLYEEYAKLMEEQSKLLSESKKNSSQDVNGLS